MRSIGKYYSWTIVDEDIAKKATDKSFFDYCGSGIPTEIRWFFNVDDIEENEKKQITIVYKGLGYEAYLTKRRGRTMISWYSPLGNKIINDLGDNHYPEAIFSRIILLDYHKDLYELTFNIEENRDNEALTKEDEKLLKELFFEMLDDYHQ